MEENPFLLLQRKMFKHSVESVFSKEISKTLCTIFYGLLGKCQSMVCTDILLNDDIMEHSNSQRPKFLISEFKSLAMPKLKAIH